MDGYDEQDYESFIGNLQIMNENENEWIFSNSNSINHSILSSDFELNSIVANDSVPPEFSLSNETCLPSPSLSDETNNELTSLPILDWGSLTSSNIQTDKVTCLNQPLTININQPSLFDKPDSIIFKPKTECHFENNYGNNTGDLNDFKCHGSLFDEKMDLRSHLSYVIIDKASFDNLLDKTQNSHERIIPDYRHSQLVQVNQNNSNNIMSVNNMKYVILSNPFQNILESAVQLVSNNNQEENINFVKGNEIPILCASIILPSNNENIVVPIYMDKSDNMDYNEDNSKTHINYTNYNLTHNSVHISQNDSTQKQMNEICVNNFSTDPHQAPSDSLTNNNENKVDRMVISENDDINSDQLCLVCGDAASCQHYGVKSCEGCKGFFKRTIQKNASQSYVCLHNQNCVIDKQNRNRCQFCRYLKCIKVGMLKEIVRKESLKGRRGRLSSKVKMKNNGAQSVYTVVNLLSTIKVAVEVSEPKCLEKLSLKEFHSIERIQKKIKSDDITSYIINELHESLKIVKQFAEKLIGFNTLSKRDQTLVLVLNGLEFITLRAGIRLFNDYLTTSKILHESLSGSIILDNGCILTKPFLTRSIFASWSNQTQELSKQLAFLHNNDKEIVNGILAVTLLKIEMDSEESKQLEDASLVYSLRHRYIEVLKTYCNSKMTLESNFSTNNKATRKTNSQSSNQSKHSNHISDPKFLSKLLDKQLNVQLIVKNHLLKPIIKHYFNTDNINDCDKVFTNLFSGQEIISFCPKWLFKLIAYKTMPHLCIQQS